MRPTHITPSHAGIPSTEGYSRDPEGARDWLEDVLDYANIETGMALDVEFARGLRYVARTALTFFPFDTAQPPAPKGWGSTD